MIVDFIDLSVRLTLFRHDGDGVMNATILADPSWFIIGGIIGEMMIVMS